MSWLPWHIGTKKRAHKKRDSLGQTAGETKNMSQTGFLSLHHTQSAHWSPRNYGALAKEGYMRNPIAHRAVRLICETAAQVPWSLFVDQMELDEHPILALLKRPNMQSFSGDFLEKLYGHLILSGNAFLKLSIVDEMPIEMHLLRPDRMRVICDQNGWPQGYEYQVGAKKQTFPSDENGNAQILHLKLFHPLDDHMGFAPLEAALTALDLHNSASQWNKSLLDNSARPSGALVYQPKEGGNLSQDQFERLKTELEDGYSGVQKAGRPMLLEGGLDWKAIGLTPKDMDFVDAKNTASRDIALALGVPPMLLGIPGDNTYSNYQEANRAFCRLTIMPLITRVAASLSGFLQPYYDGTLKLEPDYDQVPSLSSERDSLWTRINDANFLTESEKREAVGYQKNR